MKKFVIAANALLESTETHEDFCRIFYDEATSLQAAKSKCFDYLTKTSEWRSYNPVFMSIETPAGHLAFFQQIN